ncbi:MAG: drug/metabolite transporter (DMT)-like permease [Paracoccaceae bacterium]|jgi:drug/metabolite transporter (DMT)-like permease
MGGFYVGVFEMGLAFILWLKAMKLAENTAKIANLIFISPFLSLIFISVLLDEVILPSTLFGLCLIIAGLVVQQLFAKPKETVRA